jgi:hypothetical protein
MGRGSVQACCGCQNDSKSRVYAPFLGSERHLARAYVRAGSLAAAFSPPPLRNRESGQERPLALDRQCD